MRYEGIAGLNELLSRDVGAVLANASALLERLAGIFVDKDANVRRGCRNLLKKLFPAIAVERMEPLFGLPMAHLYCAMTHIDEDIRQDSLEIVDICLRYYPSLVIRDAKTFLDHFLLQVSTKKGTGDSATSTLLVSPTSKISTVKWRTEVFKRLNHVFRAMLSSVKQKEGRESEGDDVVNSSPQDLDTSIVDSMTFGAFHLRDCLQSGPRSAAGGATTVSNELDCASLHEFGGAIVPLLIDSWVEASPADHNLGRGQNKSVSSEVFELFATIVSLLKLMLELSALLHVETASSLRSTFSRKFLPDLAKRFIPFFPLHSPQNRNKPVVSASGGGAASLSSSSSSSTFVNLAICDVLTFDARLLLKTHPPSWLQPVFEHLDRFFSSAQLNWAAEDELTLAFRVIRRCLKSPSFAGQYLRPIFDRVTAVFFHLAIEPQLLFLDFFAEFLTEFSALLSHEDGFLADQAVGVWIEKLPAYLRGLVIQENNNNKSQPEASDSDDEHPNSQTESLMLRVFRLYTLTSRMNFSAFFPLTHLLDQMLSREVFSALSLEVRTRVLTLIGHAHLDDALLSLLATFLAADYHQSHSFTWETIFFRWTSTRCKDNDDDDDVGLLALTLAVFRRTSYEEALSSIEKRFGVCFVKVDQDGRDMEWNEFLKTVENENSRGINEAVKFLQRRCC